MKFFQSKSSKTQLSDFKYATGSDLPRVLYCLPCFRSLDTHHHIEESKEFRCATASPGVVARLMGLDSMPQRIGSVKHQEDEQNSNARTRSQSASQTPMVLEIENGKLFFLGFEAGDKCKGVSRSTSKRKLLEDDGSKKKKLITETSKGLLANADFDLEFFDQLVLELVYIF